MERIYSTNKTIRMKQLFVTGFAQVFLVTVQTYFISKLFYIGVLIVGFLISLVWSWNVKKIAFGSRLDRIIYSFGATAIKQELCP